MAQTKPKYIGATPGADVNDYVLFSTVAAGLPQGATQWEDVRRFSLDLAHDQAGAINVFKSQDHGVSWVQTSTTAVAIPALGTTTKFEVLVEDFEDWKVEWKNGGAEQTVWALDMLLGDDRGPSA